MACDRGDTRIAYVVKVVRYADIAGSQMANGGWQVYRG